MTSRGLRNNNPGNIRKGIAWQGMADSQPDPDFITFKAPEWGVRAIAKILLTYQNHDGLKTVRAMINRWAPPVENDTGAYVAAVASAMGTPPDAEINVDQIATMLPMVKAIIVHENGSCPYADAVLVEGCRRAGVSDAPPKPLSKSTTFHAQVITGAAVVGATCSEVAAPVKHAADALSAYTSAPVIQTVVTALLTIAGLATAAGILSSWLKQRAKV